MKKITILALLCLFFLIPLSASPASAASAEQVTVSTVTLNAEHPYYKNGDTYGTAGDYNAYFDAETGTLTLRNLDITTWRRDGIQVSNNLILVLEGTSSIKVTCSVNDNKVYYHGIDAAGLNLTVRGTGTLNIDYQSGNYGRQNTCGISVRNLAVESGVLNVNYAYSSGISATALTVTGGSIYSYGGETGIYATAITVSGGTVKAFGHDYGIRASSQLNVTGGITEVVTSTTTIPRIGINAPVCNISGGTVKAIGVNRGISSITGFYLSGGSVVVDTDDSTASYDRLGIYSGAVCITGGWLEISSGGGAFSAAPTFSSCCTFMLEQGASSSAAKTTSVLTLNHESLYVSCNTRASNHSKTVVEAVAPTCASQGSTQGVSCAKCGLYTVAPVAVSKLPHTYDQQNTANTYLKSSATCKTSAVYYLSCVCGAHSTYSSGTFSHGAPLPHTPEVLAGTAPTCETAGISEGSLCSKCRTTLVKQEPIPATGHTYTEAAFDWAEDLTSATASALCHCSHR